MKILAVHYGHNAVVGLAQDGQILSLIHEERLTRVKNATGFPAKSLAHTLQHFCHDSPPDVLVIADTLGAAHVYLQQLNWNTVPWREFPSAKLELKKLLLNQQQTHPETPTHTNFKTAVRATLAPLKTLLKKARAALQTSSESSKDIYQELLHKCGCPRARLIRLNHHDAHAWTAVPWLGDKTTLIFTLDGVGDNECATVQLWDGQRLKSLYRAPRYHSLGQLYYNITALLGMTPGEHEFKVMGLAPYASASHAGDLARTLAQLLWVDQNGHFQSAHSMFRPNLSLLEKVFAKRFDVIAGGIQLLTEELTATWINHWIRKTGINSIALCGGVFMNIKAAKRIGELPEVHSMLVVPSAGDESLVIGCIAAVNHQHGIRTEPLHHLYLGTDCTPSIPTVLEDAARHPNLKLTQVPESELPTHIAQILAHGGIVGVCHGREEWGARALGHRSILADPRCFHTIQRLNDTIKCRDFWMPFAPAILHEHAHHYLINPKNFTAPFMNLSFDSTPLGRQTLQAAVHPRDGTLRPQILTPQHTPLLHAITTQFHRLTGVAAVLNTSFNLHGQPNVSSAADALHTLLNSGLQYITLNNWLIEKTSLNTPSPTTNS